MGAGGSVPSSETEALALGYTPEQITAYMEAQSPAKSSSRSISPQGSPGAAPDKSKMSFLGAPGSGKSSLITRFMGNGFNAAMETKALQYHSKNLKDGTLRLQVWDTAGRSRSQIPSAIKDADYICVIFDTTDRRSFSDASKLIDEVAKFRRHQASIRRASLKDVIVILVGNKKDLVDQRVVTKEEAKYLADSKGTQYFETSAKAPDVEELFTNIVIPPPPPTKPETVAHEKIVEAFIEMDKDGDGKISVGELQEATGMTTEEAVDLMNQIDTNNDGELSFEELKAAVEVPAQELDGKALAATIKEEVATGSSKLSSTPCLMVVAVGDLSPAQESYKSVQTKAAEKCGIDVRHVELPHSASTAEIVHFIQLLGDDRAVDAILVALPLPSHVDSPAVLAAIPASKDVDGASPSSQADLNPQVALEVASAQGRPHFAACTALACMALLQAVPDLALRGSTVAVVGATGAVGFPLSLLLLQAGATVVSCHVDTRDPAKFCRDCDVVVTCVGKVGLVKGDWVKPGAVVIDVGINAGPDGGIVGDVAFDEVVMALGAAGHITPVPGGVGPVTTAILMRQTLRAAIFHRIQELSNLARMSEDME